MRSRFAMPVPRPISVGRQHSLVHPCARPEPIQQRDQGRGRTRERKRERVGEGRRGWGQGGQWWLPEGHKGCWIAEFSSLPTVGSKQGWVALVSIIILILVAADGPCRPLNCRIFLPALHWIETAASYPSFDGDFFPIHYESAKNIKILIKTRATHRCLDLMEGWKQNAGIQGPSRSSSGHHQPCHPLPPSSSLPLSPSFPLSGGG